MIAAGDSKWPYAVTVQGVSELLPLGIENGGQRK